MGDRSLGIKITRIEQEHNSACGYSGCYGEADEAEERRKPLIAEGQKKSAILVAEGIKSAIPCTG